MTAAATADGGAARKNRKTVLIVAGVVLGALLLAAGALPTWWTLTWQGAVTAARQSSLTGRQSAPALLPLALAAVAGLAAVAAARGVARRLLGALLMLVGAVSGWAVVSGIGHRPVTALQDAQPQAQQVLSGTRNLFGPVLSMLGAGLVLLAGVAVLAGLFAGRGMGSRFNRHRPAAAATPDRLEDADLWKRLDAGEDPTAQPQTPRRDP